MYLRVFDTEREREREREAEIKMCSKKIFNFCVVKFFIICHKRRGGEKHSAHITCGNKQTRVRAIATSLGRLVS